MDARGQHEENAHEPASDHVVTSHHTSPGRLVLTERDNCEAWIACEGAVELRR